MHVMHGNKIDDINNGINLPLPYESYYDYKTIFSTVDDYRRTLLEWRHKNCSKRPIETDVTHMMDAADQTNVTNKIRQWMIDHIDKLVYLYDFSGMKFGLYVDQRTELFHILDLEYASKERLLRYPQYDADHYLSLSVFGKLDWMYDNCEFIPIRLLTEDVLDDQSHKWSHIKKDPYAMKLLEAYLDSAKYSPNDDVYYYIRYGTYGRFLKRDLEMSPKKRSTSNAD